MGGRLTRAGVAGLILAAALAGCSSGGDSAFPTATLGTAPPVTPTTDPYAVPAVIDAAYVNRVLAGLDAAVGEVVRIVVRDRTIPQEVLDRLDALYVGEFVQIRRDLLAVDVQTGLSNYHVVPGNQKTVVSELISTNRTCVFARVQRDYSAVALKPNRAFDTQWVILKPLDGSRDPRNYNPTPWAYIYDGFEPDRTAPPDQCVTT